MSIRSEHDRSPVAAREMNWGQLLFVISFQQRLIANMPTPCPVSVRAVNGQRVRSPDWTIEEGRTRRKPPRDSWNLSLVYDLCAPGQNREFSSGDTARFTQPPGTSKRPPELIRHIVEFAKGQPVGPTVVQVSPRISMLTWRSPKSEVCQVRECPLDER